MNKSEVGSDVNHTGNIDNATELLKQAEYLRISGNPGKALSVYKRLLAIAPDNYQALNNYGTLLRTLGDNPESLQALLRANALLPNNHIILTNLASTYASMDRHDLAVRSATNALAIQQDFLDALMVLGQAYFRTGEYELAIQTFSQALEHRPSNIGIITALATALHYTGDSDAAYKLIQPLIKEHCRECANVYYKIASKLGMQETAVAYIKDLLEKTGKTKANQSWKAPLHFSLGKYYDSIAQYDAAIEHYHTANNLCRRKFDIAQTKSQIDRIIETFDEASLEDEFTSSNHSSKPIFVLGMPRSGTSLVEKVLDSHPQIYGAGELKNIHHVVQHAKQCYNLLSFPANVAALQPCELDSLANEYLEQINQLSGNAARVVDKMPHNFMHIGLISRLFPNATIIHCQRNPLDTCLSYYFSNFDNLAHNHSYNLSDLGSYYLQYYRLMQHWLKISKGRIFQVRYEDMVTDLENTSRRLVGICGQEWHDACLDFHKNKRITHTVSYDQVSRPIYSDSLYRWKNYERHIKDLIDTLAVPMNEYND